MIVTVTPDVPAEPNTHGDELVATKTKALPTPTDNQRAVLDALAGGRKVSVTDDGKKKTVALTTKAGGAVKDAPKLNRAAVESCIAKGWVSPAGDISDDGKAAKKRK